MAVSKSFNLSCTSPSKSHQLSGDPYHRKQGGIGINSEVFTLKTSHWNDNPNLNPVLEITKPRSCFSTCWQPKLSKRFKKTQKNACERIRPPSELNLKVLPKRSTIQKPPMFTPNKQKHNTNDSQTHIWRLETPSHRDLPARTRAVGRSEDHRPARFRVLIWGKFYCKQWGYQMKRRSFGGSNTVHLSSSEGFRRNGKKSTSWLAKEFTGWKCVNEATKNSAPIASRRPLLCEGFHKTRHTSTCTRTKVHRRCLARSEIRDMTMCWKNLGEWSKNYLPRDSIWFSYIWTDQKKISLLSLCKVYWVYLGVAYGCRTWRTSNAMKYTSKFHTSILLFLSWTHCVVISIQTEASQAVTGCRLPWATNPLVKRLLMLLSILSGDLDSSSHHCLFEMHIAWCCRFCWFTWCCHPWCRWIAFFLEKQPGSPNSVRSPTKRRSIMDPRRVLENQMTLNSQLVGLLLVLWL